MAILSRTSSGTKQRKPTSVLKNPDPKGRKKNCNDKVEEITNVLLEENIDLWKLRELCLTKGGLVNDTLRKKAWPKLVGLDMVNMSSTNKIDGSKGSNTELPEDVEVVDPSSVQSKGYNKVMARSLDAEQIDRDTSRCTWHLLTGSQRSQNYQIQNKHRKKISSLLKRKQRRLGNLINLVLLQSYEGSKDVDKLRYYQGYHDISCIFLGALGGNSETGLSQDADNYSMDSGVVSAATKTAQAMGLNLACKVLLRISQSHLRDSLRNNFRQLTTALRLVIMPLIGALDAEVHSHLVKCEMEPFFAISWIITWFSHDIRDTTLVKRLFDVFIASHPLMAIYMSIAMVLHPVNREEVLTAECDFAAVHKALSQLPRNSCTVGWKYIGTTDDSGYFSGDDGEGDEVMSMDASVTSDDFLLDGIDDDDSSAPSLTSSVSQWSSGGPSRVSFDELIDLAIHFMRRIPPRNLIPLARKYYRDPSAKMLLAESSTIALLQPPPSWGLANTISSDWFLKKRMRESRGLNRTNRRVRRARSRSRNRSRSRPRDSKENGNHKEEIISSEESPDTARGQNFLSAIIAAGIGPDGDKEMERARGRRKLAVVGVVTVGIVAIAWGLAQTGVVSIPIFLSSKQSESDGGNSAIDGREYAYETSSDISSGVTDTKISFEEREICFNHEPSTSSSENSGKVTKIIKSNIAERVVVVERTNISKNRNDGKHGPIRLIKALAKSAKMGLAQSAEDIAL